MFFEGLGRVCFLIIAACSTVTVCFSKFTARTFPVRPLARPAITFTWSRWRPLYCDGFRIGLAMSSPHFRRERDDLGELLVAQFASYGTEHAGADGLVRIVDQDGRVIVEADVV